MDQDADLIAQLCSRAGMIMEEASVLAITGPDGQAGPGIGTLIELSSTTHTIGALVSAAIALQQYISR